VKSKACLRFVIGAYLLDRMFFKSLKIMVQAKPESAPVCDFPVDTFAMTVG